MRLKHGYQARPVTFLGIWDVKGWRLKTYGIAWARARPREELVDASRLWAERLLVERPTALEHYGVGFIGIHDGRGENQVFLDRWVGENELLHDYVVSRPDTPRELRAAPVDHNSVCVWDLAVQWFEREAWVECVLKRPERPDVEEYLARRLQGRV